MFCSTLPPVGGSRRQEGRPCPGTAPCPPGTHTSHSGLCSRFECRLKSDLPSHVLQHSTSRGWEQETGGQTLPWHCTLPSRHTHVSQRSAGLLNLCPSGMRRPWKIHTSSRHWGQHRPRGTSGLRQVTGAQVWVWHTTDPSCRRKRVIIKTRNPKQHWEQNWPQGNLGFWQVTEEHFRVWHTTAPSWLREATDVLH